MKITIFFFATGLSVVCGLTAQNTIDCANNSFRSVPVTTKTGTNTIFTQPAPVRVPPTGPLGPNIDKRFVFWMHGIGGNDGAWQDAFAATEANLVSDYPARDCHNRVMDYFNFSSAISSAGVKIKTDMEDLSDGKHQNPSSAYMNFIIAHSQGGLVARSVDRIFDAEGNSSTNFRRMGGIVTFGTPHQGAMIINNVLPQNGNVNMLDQFTKSACTDLSSGIIAEKTGSSWLISLFLNGSFVERITDTLCNNIGVFIPKYAFKDFNQKITQDYRVGSAYLDSLNKDTSSIHHLAFYGIEDDETMAWRTMHYLFNKPNDEDYFDAIHDSIGVVWANDNRKRYIARYEAWYALAQSYGSYPSSLLFNLTHDPVWQAVICQNLGLPQNCLNNVTNLWSISNAWRKGVNWWNTANDQYRAIIGAIEYQTQIGPQCYCQSCHEWEYTGECIQWGEEYEHDVNDCTNEGENGLYGRELRRCSQRNGVYLVKNTKPADGIVLAESAGKYPIGNGQYAPAEVMPGSNHQQMRNDSNTKKKLRAVFDGNTADPWFFTRPK